MKANKRRLWTPEDEAFLLDSYGYISNHLLVKRLKRSEEAIRQKFHLLEGTKDLQVASGLLSTRLVADALGVQKPTITNWIRKEGLPSIQLQKAKDSNKRHRHFIDANHLWQWVSENKQRIDFSHVKRGVLLPEPTWLDGEISKCTYQKRPTNWTKDEDDLAYYFWQGGMSCDDIAQRINRPVNGVRRRLTMLKKSKVSREKAS